MWAYWPVVIILIGLSFVFGRGRVAGQRAVSAGQGRKGGFTHTDVFGGGDSKFDGDVFPGGQMTAMFGGGKVDLTGTKLPPDGATLDVTAVFGGYEIFVPKDWRVDLRATVLFGGASDERKERAEAPAGTLIITGTVLFGGLSVK